MNEKRPVFSPLFLLLLTLNDIGVPITEMGVEEVDVLLLIVTGRDDEAAAGGRSWSVEEE